MPEENINLIGLRFLVQLLKSKRKTVIVIYVTVHINCDTAV